MIGELPNPNTTQYQKAERESWLNTPLVAALTWEHVLYALIIAVAVVTRLYDMGARVMSHDESLHTYYSYNLAMGKGFQHTPLMHGPFLFHITALSYFLFGDSDFTARLPFALMGIVFVVLPVFFRKQLGRNGALIASIALLISPSILYHARYIRQEQSVLLWTMLTALCVWRYLETRKWSWLVGLTVVLAFHATDKSTSFLTIALFLVFLVPLALWQLYTVRNNVRDALMLVAFGAVLGGLLLLLSAVYALSAGRLAVLLNLQNVIVGSNPVVLSLDRQELIFIGILLVFSVVVAALMGYLLRHTFGNWLDHARESAPALTVILVMVCTTLFMGSAAVLLVLNKIWHAASGADLVAISLLGEMSNLNTNAQVVTTMFSIGFALIVISIAIGVAWHLRSWLILVAVFIGISVPLFTSLFTNGAGIGSGYVGMLGYWMAQQDVKRGSQPWYYYLLIVPMYEYVLVIGTLCAAVYLIVKLVTAQKQTLVQQTETQPTPNPELDDVDVNHDFLPIASAPAALHPLLFPAFLIWWTAATWLIYSIAGEKMPWLTVHFALPMALLTGWFLNSVLNNALLDQLKTRYGWALLGLGTLAVVLMGRVLSTLWGDNFATESQVDRIGSIGGLIVTLVALAAVIWAMRKVNAQAPADGASPSSGSAFVLAAFALLGVLTVRTSITANYWNYDYTKEFLFYAHGAPGVKIALNQIEDLSKRLGGKDPIKIGYDSDTSWPMTWYMRNFAGQRFYGETLPADYEDLQVVLVGDGNPKRGEIEPQLEGKFTKFDYMLVWWPMQDYFDLEKAKADSTFGADGSERIRYMLATPERREALWQIFWNRNYEPYAKIFNRTDLTPENWNPGHRFGMYVRNDIVGQVWDYRVGEIVGGPIKTNPLTNANTKVQALTSIAFTKDGARFGIDHRANRVFELDGLGTVVRSFGGFGGGQGKFNDAWGIAIDANNNILVADTFNHRIQKFDREGNFISQWGKPGVSDQNGTGQDTVFFGPRDIKPDKNGNLLVTDTGNNRVQVFDGEGNFIAQIGRKGTGNGEFQEPVGIALDNEGNIYVTDTWNKRVQVFNSQYQFVRTFTVDTWATMDPGLLTSVEHKPYLAIDGNTLFISSPRTAQVLAYSLNGQAQPLPQVSFNPTDWPTGLAIFNGNLVVANAANGQVLEFPLAAKAQ